MLAVLASGAAVEQRPALSPRRALADMAGATVYLGVPAIYRTAADVPVAAPPDLSGVRFLLSCTAPLSPGRHPAVRDPLRRRDLPALRIVRDGRRGQSQPGRGAAATRLGRPRDRAASPCTSPRTPASSSSSGPAVAAGYALGAPAGPSPLAAGSFRTGDLAEIDADGFIRIDGRRDAVINVGGLKVSPQEVSEALERHPAVRQAAVLGVPDGNGDELVAAAVVLERGVRDAELIAHCSGELAEHKVPRRIVVLRRAADRADRQGPAARRRLRAETRLR